MINFQNLITEPFTSVKNAVLNTMYLQTGLVQSAGKLGFLQFQNEKKVEGIALERIHNVVRALGFKPEQVICIEKDGLNSPCASFGTIKDDAVGVLLFEPYVLEKIRENLTDFIKFAIAHEIGHLVKDDSFEGDYTNLRNCDCVRLLAFTTSAIALSFFTSIPINYLASCGIAKVIGFFASSYLSHQKELAADSWAAQKFPEEGHNFCEHLSANCPSYKKQYVEHFENESKKTDSKLEKGIFAVKKLFYKYLVKDEDIFSSWSHPSLSRRKNAINQFKRH